jgi:hypothetical protein
MPKIYKYLGYIFLFYANEHTPIHTHVQQNDKEMKAEITYDKQGIVIVRFKRVNGKKVFNASEKAEIELFILRKHEQIVRKWHQFFTEGKKPKFEEINTRLKKVKKLN